MEKVLTIVAVLALALSGPALAGGKAKAQSGSLSAAQSGSISYIEGDTNTSITPDELKTVPDAVAPALTTTMTETCMGSTSVATSWLGFGFSGGTTWRDDRCADRLDARQFGNFAVQIDEPKLVWAGVELMCTGERQAALARAGIVCGEQPEAAPAVQAEVVREAEVQQVTYTQPDLPTWFVSNDY